MFIELSCSRVGGGRREGLGEERETPRNHGFKISSCHGTLPVLQLLPREGFSGGADYGLVNLAEREDSKLTEFGEDLDFLIYVWEICAYKCDTFSGNHGTRGDREGFSAWLVGACSRLCVIHISWNGNHMQEIAWGPNAHVFVDSVSLNRPKL